MSTRSGRSSAISEGRSLNTQYEIRNKWPPIESTCHQLLPSLESRRTLFRLVAVYVLRVGPRRIGHLREVAFRILLGLAFGIEGMTLVRSFLIDTEESTVKATDAPPVLEEEEALAPSLAPSLRARRLRLRATREEWTFVVTTRPDSALSRAVTLAFPQLTLSNGTVRTSAPSRTWAPGDTASFAASWTLPVGQPPDALTVTVTAPASPDSTTSVTRTMDVGHVPVRMQ